MCKRKIKTALMAFLILLAGCAQNYQYRYIKPVEKKQDIIDISYEATDVLIQNLSVDIPKRIPLMATSFANIDNLEESSTLGRLLSEQIASRMSQKGYSVVEIKLSQESLFFKERTGEFILSRKLENISSEFNAHYVIVGTYSVGGASVYVSARIVRVSDNLIVSSSDFKLQSDSDVYELVQNRKEVWDEPHANE